MNTSSESITVMCQICKKVLPLASFHKDSSRNSGYSRKCKSCKSKKNAAYRKSHRDKDWVSYQRERLKDDSKRSKMRLQQKAWQLRNPIVVRAYWAVHHALRDGKIIRPQECCKCKKTCTPEAHHEDYSKPLDVVWLCKSCHEDRHHATQ